MWLVVFFGEEVLAAWLVALTRFECLSFNQELDRILFPSGEPASPGMGLPMYWLWPWKVFRLTIVIG